MQDEAIPAKEAEFRSGFVAIVGRANVGKSTLLNRLLGRKLAIVSPKPQTTRNRILGVKTTPRGQIILLDTPGVHDTSHGSKLHRYMARVAELSCRDVDLILFMVDVRGAPHAEDRALVRRFAKVRSPVMLALNKIDRIPKPEVLTAIDTCRQLFNFCDLVPISALQGENVERLEALLLERLPVGPAYFPAATLTDQPERFLIGELIREQLMMNLHEELPHATAVIVEEMRETGQGTLHIGATVLVEKESQKGIVIGKDGQMIKRIGELARKEIARFVGSDVYLELWVKVKRNWSRSEVALRELGYTEH